MCGFSEKLKQANGAKPLLSLG